MGIVEAFCKMSFGDEVIISGKAECTVERGSKSIDSETAVTWDSADCGMVKSYEGGVECIKNFLKCFRFEFCTLLAESGRRWGVWVKAKEIKQFDPC